MGNKTWEEIAKEEKARLSEPAHEVFSDNTYRTRRNLLATSVIALFYSLGSDGIQPESSSLLGVKFIGVGENGPTLVLMLFLVYFFIHFSWCAIDDFTAWKLRLTGAKATKPKDGGAFAESGFSAGGSQQKQLTISAWWTENINSTQGVFNLLTDDKVIHELTTSSQHSAADAKRLTETRATLNQIKQNIDQLSRHSPYICTSLEIYEKGFNNFDISQKLRWRFFEFHLPITIATIAMVALESTL